MNVDLFVHLARKIINRNILSIWATWFISLHAVLWASQEIGMAALPQKGKVDDVSFVTVDGVILRGTLYKGDNVEGTKSPCIMVLHGWGLSGSTKPWKSFATVLQKKGCTVLLFDFRGHGKSTQLNDKTRFWNKTLFPDNVAYVKCPENDQAALPNSIHFRNFDNYYFPWLIQDVAAARRFLDLQNDDKQCNTSELYIVAERRCCVNLWTFG